MLDFGNSTRSRGDAKTHRGTGGRELDRENQFTSYDLDLLRARDASVYASGGHQMQRILPRWRFGLVSVSDNHRPTHRYGDSADVGGVAKRSLALSAFPSWSLGTRRLSPPQ